MLSIMKIQYSISIGSLGVWDYDHKDGNRSNNHARNCQALCPNCHAKKTGGLLKREKKPYIVWAFRIVLIIVFLISLRVIDVI
jgi:hypothetical protein